MSINKRIGFPKDSPEKTLISRYYIKQKYVQVMLDTSSFPNTKTLKSTMNLAKMLFNNLENDDYFGMKVLKNGYQGYIQSQMKAGINQPSQYYLQDVLVLEKKQMNTSVKSKYLDDFTKDLQNLNKQHVKSNRVSGREA